MKRIEKRAEDALKELEMDSLAQITGVSKDFHNRIKSMLRVMYRIGFRQAREDAATTVENCGASTCTECGDILRRLGEEEA